MCNIWAGSKKQELSLKQLESLLSDKLFNGVEVINITGGEPTLRKDLVQIALMIQHKLPELKKVTLTTNALDTARVVRSCEEIARYYDEEGIDFLVEMSLDGLAEIHDTVRNVPNAFRRVRNTILKLRHLSEIHNFRISVNTVITPINLHGIQDLYNWCKQQDLDEFFTLPSISKNYYSNLDKQFLIFTNEDKEYLVDLLDRFEKEKFPNFLAYYYHDLVRMTKNHQQRTTPCVFTSDAFILDGYGDMYYCMKGEKIGNCLSRSCSEIYFDPKNLAHRQEIIENECPRCFINCFSSIALGKEITRYIRYLTRSYK